MSSIKILGSETRIYIDEQGLQSIHMSGNLVFMFFFNYFFKSVYFLVVAFPADEMRFLCYLHAIPPAPHGWNSCNKGYFFLDYDM